MKKVLVEMKGYTFEELKDSLDVWHKYVMEQTRTEVLRLCNPNGEDIVYRNV